MSKVCNMTISSICSALSRLCGNIPCVRAVRRRFLSIPRKYIILWGSVSLLCVYMVVSDLLADSRGPLGDYTGGERLDWLKKTQQKKEDIRKINEDTKVVTVNGEGGKRATIYRKPPEREVPLPVDTSGRFPQDDHIITWDGLIMEAKGKKNGSKDLAFPPMPKTYEVGDGKVIAWERNKNKASFIDPVNVPLPADKRKKKELTYGRWNPLNMLRKAFPFGKPHVKKTTVKYVPPTFPPMPADDMDKKKGDKDRTPGLNQKPQREFPKEIRKAECSQCFRYLYQHHISPADVCAKPDAGNEQRVQIIIAIMTGPKEAHARHTIRATWLRYSNGNQASLRYVFVMGATSRQEQQDAVNKESSIYNDILQCGFDESPYNMTLKVMCAFNWIKQFCRLARFVVRTDDHAYLNVPEIINMLKQKGDILEYSLTGSCSLVTKVIRNQNHQWYVSYEEFPDAVYPPYCSGPTYITSMRVAEAVVEQAPDVPFFVFDDVYLGLVARKMRLNLYNQVTYFTPELSAGGCPNGSPWFSVPGVQPREMRVLYERCQTLKA